jgi:hypothetical protein
MGQCSALNAWGSDTGRFRARDRSYAVGVLNQATVTTNARQTVPSAQCAADHTIRLAASVGFSIQRLMSRSMKFLQLNLQKQRNVQHSVMNDASLKEHAALIISEPYVIEMEGKVRTSPRGHQSWTAILPSERHSLRWAVRSILWVRKDMECEQVSVPSADLTVVLLRLPDRSVLLASVYVEGANAAALSETVMLLDTAISTARRRGGPRLDIVVAGDFNRHDQLWGDEVLPSRQGEADPIIDLHEPMGTREPPASRHEDVAERITRYHDRPDAGVTGVGLERAQVQSPRHGTRVRSSCNRDAV